MHTNVKNTIAYNTFATINSKPNANYKLAPLNHKFVSLKC